MKPEEHPGVDELKELQAEYGWSEKDMDRYFRYGQMCKTGSISKNTYDVLIATMKGLRDSEIFGGYHENR